MLVFRIEKKKYQPTYPPHGSRFANGRWSTKDMWVVYTSENIALAKLETLANSGSRIPQNRFVLTLEIDDDTPLAEITVNDLPQNWHDYPSPKQLAEIVKDIMNSQLYVGAIVPSVQSPREKNILLFPEHPEFGRCVSRLDETDEYFDPRLK
ncbi:MULTISPECIES: RES family NAD+ phosphorylase [unclassified Imperialibacter]|uniref:RES family NAD+ phosphorylase n=1 Tax=unclassified Imperialibacter TaxID=2629706 RepID=UPI00125AF0F4|nr:MULTISPECIES: RES family NAD+ phosphorylase [unclassified Imperialibacter]CAD5293157.1 conserved hypothetical protein [Imperialibacter sp. 89]CAD5294242.1 conserved hypothetical protein [Imperialibacter sp. 75]VVT18467.1 conserved hypothetical protein [Imperialibacter sp. EC-SDR9]